jgi:hypothetical protein
MESGTPGILVVEVVKMFTVVQTSLCLQMPRVYKRKPRFLGNYVISIFHSTLRLHDVGISPILEFFRILLWSEMTGRFNLRLVEES